MQWEEVSALLCVSLASVLLLAVTGWLRRTRWHASYGYLLALLVLVTVQAVTYLYHQQRLFETWPHLLKVADPFIVMLPFCLYGYIRSLLGEQPLASSRDLLRHGWPLLLVASLALPYWLLPAGEKVRWILLGRQDEVMWPGVTLFGNHYLAVIAVLGVGYWWQQRAQGISCRKPALRAWINRLQSLQLLVALLLLGRITLGWFDLRPSTVYMQAPITAYLLLLILDHARLPQQQAVGSALRHSARPAEGCGLVPEERADELQPLFDELECRLKKGAYQDSALSLGKLAGSCGLTLHQASSAINRCSGGNFYDLVNRYRVEEAKRLLWESGESVATICYRAGFNSKSTFNVAFRRHTGLTPKEFRRQGLMNPEAQ